MGQHSVPSSRRPSIFSSSALGILGAASTSWLLIKILAEMYTSWQALVTALKAFPHDSIRFSSGLPSMNRNAMLEYAVHRTTPADGA